jgi:adenylate cyclase
MLSLLRRANAGVLAGIVALPVIIGTTMLMPPAWHKVIRENAFDLVLSADRRLRSDDRVMDPRVVVVDIDRRSLGAVGPWPWPRDSIARLIEAIAAVGPAVIAIDILFEGPDTRSPAALARQLGNLIDRPELLALADQLTDGDRRLAAALARGPAVLGFALSPGGSASLSGVPVFARGSVPLDLIWRADGAVGPPAVLTDAAAGLGAVSLLGDADGTIRHVPLLVLVGGVLRPGLALETVRLANKSSSYLLQSSPAALTANNVQIPLTRDASLRLVLQDPLHHEASTISAADVIAGNVDQARLVGAIVVIGGSAPELGGLRAAAENPVAASVQIQAGAISQILRGRFPQEVHPWIERSLLVAICIAALVAAGLLPPVGAAALVAAAIAIFWIASVISLVHADRLLDPLVPSIAGSIVFIVASVVAFASTRRREARVRRRFEQHLAPAVVRRIVEQPGLLKFRGERREVTALFTDVEGFTAMTHRAEPERLIAALDDYFEGMAAIVIEHGGMVDKIVGDAIHAFFNVPVDLAGHPQRAVDCAIAMRTWTAEFRRRPVATTIGFGRTRIGVETGPAVVGDVGIRAKLDYTAHGDAVNAAARLEAMNKELGSTICVGSNAAARCDPALFRPLGRVTIRGRDDAMLVFEPWPNDAPQTWRDAYVEAFGTIGSDQAGAVADFERLLAMQPDDPVPRHLIERLLKPSQNEGAAHAVSTGPKPTAALR